MSQAPESTPPAPQRPSETPAHFGAGAFEAQVPREECPVPVPASEPAVERITLEPTTPPAVIELPAPVGSPPELAVPIAAVPPAPSTPPIEHMVAEPPRPAPTEPERITSAPRPRAQEVDAVPVSRFDAPAPTIDVEARRVPPPPPVRPPEPVAPPPHSSPPPVSQPTPAAAALNSAASRWWAMFCHLFLFLAIPTLFLGGLLTFLVWQLAGRKDALVSDQGREALNFQITVALVTALLFVSCLGWPLILVVWFVAGVYCLLAAVRAFGGQSYRYPLILRIVRA
ncbi:MAG: DUF4870 domain-containing protein [Planctomycetes bacterium]|nr:DUF4870 domain-containing protein [Planctomycetota bacterium]